MKLYIHQVFLLFTNIEKNGSFHFNFQQLKKKLRTNKYHNLKCRQVRIYYIMSITSNF